MASSNNNVVALFDDRSEAEQIRRELIAQGIGEGNIRLIAQNNSAGDGSASAGSSSSAEPSMWEDIKEFFGFGHEADRDEYAEGIRRGGTFVSVTAPQDRVQGAIDILMRHHPVDIEQRSAEWKASGWQGYGAAQTGQSTNQAARTTARAQTDTSRSAAAASRPATTTATSQQTASQQTTAEASNLGANQARQAIPVVEEQIEVGKRQVRQGGVRIYTHVTEKPVEQQVSLRDERVTVERRPVDRPVTDASAFADKAYEVVETHEEPVVKKEARVVEEVVVNKDVRQRTETVRDTVRRRDVDVQQVQPGQVSARSESRTNPDDSDYRRIYESQYARGGTAYDQWLPAYQYGSQLASDQQYQGRDWTTIESDARRSYEQKNPGSTWDSVKDTIRSAYTSVKSKV